MPHISRRAFLGTAGKGVLASTVVAGAASNANAAPSERVRHAVIGVGGQGSAHLEAFSSLDDCEVVAVCDVDPKRRSKGAKRLPKPDTVAQIEDFRTILDDSTIDAISIATCDHWHVPIALAAIMAGKHVYVEKPCGHNMREGVLLEAAAKQYKKCVQHGTQRRSAPNISEVIRKVQEGVIGKIRVARVINHQLRGPIGPAAESEPPDGVNYDLWIGPAPKHAFTANRWHYNWHWFWDYGTGDIGNDGVHHLDLARWGLNVGLPNAVTASGGPSILR